MRHLKLTLTDEEYERVREAAGFEPMASYARRQLFPVLENGQKTLKTKAREESVAVKVEANPARLAESPGSNPGTLARSDRGGKPREGLNPSGQIPEWLSDKVLPASQLPEPAKKKRKLNLGGEPTGPRRMDYTKTWGPQ